MTIFPQLGITTKLHTLGSTCLILQAANNGIPVIDLMMPEDLQIPYDQIMHRLRRSPALPSLGDLFQMFDDAFLFKKPSSGKLTPTRSRLGGIHKHNQSLVRPKLILGNQDLTWKQTEWGTAQS